jgi:hypothetical protein
MLEVIRGIPWQVLRFFDKRQNRRAGWVKRDALLRKGVGGEWFAPQDLWLCG